MCTCDPIFTWELIDASDVLFFKAPLLDQGVHKVFVSNDVFDSLSVCFKDVFQRVVGTTTDRAIGIYQFHNENTCAFVKRRYTLESVNTLLSLLQEENFFRKLCHCSKERFDSFCQECVDQMLCSEVPYPSVPAAQLKSIMSRQTEWSTWYSSSVNFTCNIDEMWMGNMAYNYPSFQEDTCSKIVHRDYTIYSLNYEKQKLNVYISMCQFCHVPLRYSTILYRECQLAFADL